MALLWAAIVQFLFYVVPPFLWWCARALGIGYIAYKSASVALDYAQNFVMGYYNGLPASVYALLTMAGFDMGVKMVFAAYVARVATSAASGKWTGPWNKDTVLKTGRGGGSLPE